MPVRLLSDDAYEEMAAAFQCALIQLLDASLRRQNIAPSVRRSICGDFAGTSGGILDQYWIDSPAGKVFPVIAFARRHPDYDPDEMFMNNGAFSFSEYAGGNIQWYFEEHAGQESPVAMGLVGQDGEPKE